MVPAPRHDPLVQRGLGLPSIVAPDDLTRRAATVPAKEPGRPLSPFFKPAATTTYSAAQTRRGEGGPQLEGQAMAVGSLMGTGQSLSAR